jgi:hypothetical protein
MTRQAVYVPHNNDRSWNHCYGGKTISITYFESVFVALGIQMQSACSYCHMWNARMYNIFPHYLIDSKIFEKKKN